LQKNKKSPNGLRDMQAYGYEKNVRIFNFILASILQQLQNVNVTTKAKDQTHATENRSRPAGAYA